MTSSNSTHSVTKSKIIDIINEKISNNERFFSLEYYPPKTAKGVKELKEVLYRMHSWGSQWMDITWGAGGVTSDLTPDIADHIENKVNGNCLMHLTCTNMPKEKVDVALAKAKELGLLNILALRGDPPKGETEWQAIDGGFSCALDLVKYIELKYPNYFGITVSGYPEGHPLVRHPITDTNWNSSTNQPKYWAINQLEDGTFEGVSDADWNKELLYLKSKIDAGGQVIITQLFYDVQIFLDYVREVRRIGITAPIMPGIMPINSYGLFLRMTGFCKTVVPAALKQGLSAVKDNQAKMYEFGMKWMCDLCQQILDAKLNKKTNENLVPGIHIYTMNMERAAIDILQRLKFGDTAMINDEHIRVMKEYKQKLALKKLSPKKSPKKKNRKQIPKCKITFHKMTTF